MFKKEILLVIISGPTVPQMSMNVQQELTTVMEWLTVITMKDPSHAAAGKVILETG